MVAILGRPTESFCVSRVAALAFANPVAGVAEPACHLHLAAGKGRAKFEAPYIRWGLKDPSNWLLKVKPAVEVDPDLAGAW